MRVVPLARKDTGQAGVVGELGRFRVHMSMVLWSSQEELSSALWFPPHQPCAASGTLYLTFHEEPCLESHRSRGPDRSNVIGSLGTQSINQSPR